MAGTQYAYPDNKIWVQHPILTGPCLIQVQTGDECLVHFGAITTTAQVDTVTVNNAVDGNTYAVDVDGTVYSYVAGVSSTLATIANGLAALIPNGVSDAVDTITITSAVAGTPQVVSVDATTTVPADLTAVTTVPNAGPIDYEGIEHHHLANGEPFRYTGAEAIWLRTHADNVAGMTIKSKVACSPIV